ncbi:neutral zinc metallopeptidase [Nonomuraea sp. NPDC002799]
MKLLKTVVLAGVLMMPLAGTALAESTAYPVKHPKLIANPLYEAGALPATACEEPPVKPNNRQQGRAYFEAVITCLETTWGQHLTQASLPYKKVKVRHVDKVPKKYCGYQMSKDDSQVWYCAKNSTMLVQLGREWLKDPSDLWLFYVASSMYGQHVQNLVGIDAAFDAAPYDGNRELNEQSRRYNLQSDCLAGAFAKSVWPMKDRTKADWAYLLSLPEGDARGTVRTAGKEANIVAWVKRGFATGDPGSCNTWTASSAKVA